MSLIRTNVVPIEIRTRSVYPKKPIKVGEHNCMAISFEDAKKIDIPGIELGLDMETDEILYRKDGGEWITMGKEE